MSTGNLHSTRSAALHTHTTTHKPTLDRTTLELTLSPPSEASAATTSGVASDTLDIFHRYHRAIGNTDEKLPTRVLTEAEKRKKLLDEQKSREIVQNLANVKPFLEALFEDAEGEAGPPSQALNNTAPSLQMLPTSNALATQKAQVQFASKASLPSSRFRDVLQREMSKPQVLSFVVSTNRLPLTTTTARSTYTQFDVSAYHEDRTAGEMLRTPTQLCFAQREIQEGGVVVTDQQRREGGDEVGNDEDRLMAEEDLDGMNNNTTRFDDPRSRTSYPSPSRMVASEDRMRFSRDVGVVFPPPLRSSAAAGTTTTTGVASSPFISSPGGRGQHTSGLGMMSGSERPYYPSALSAYSSTGSDAFQSAHFQMLLATIQKCKQGQH